MKFGQLMEVHHSDAYITPRHEDWLSRNPNPVYGTKALELAQEALSTPQRDRTQSFSASSIGGCPRAAQFQFLGLPQKTTGASLNNIFHTGNFIHLKWQMAGLTEGWLAEAEPFITNEQLWLKGSLDGILDNGDGLEIKSINSNGYRQVLAYGGKKDHLAQIDAYFLMCPRIKAFSLVYENKDTGDYKEIRVQRDEERVEALKQKLFKLQDMMHNKVYMDMRDDCWKGEGMFRSCFYAPICADQGTEIRI